MQNLPDVAGAKVAELELQISIGANALSREVVLHYLRGRVVSFQLRVSVSNHFLLLGHCARATEHTNTD
jgi:hypothetical protein